MSDRDRQQRVDLPAVKHHSLARELPAATVTPDPIEVTLPTAVTRIWVGNNSML
jgi:hypothetical protein